MPLPENEAQEDEAGEAQDDARLRHGAGG